MNTMNLDVNYRNKPRHSPYGTELCSVGGCLNIADKRGWCDKHWKRWRRHGDPEAIADQYKLLPGEAAQNQVITRYKRNAENRNLSVSLTNDELSILFKMNCYYCGNAPSNRFSEKGYRGDFVYNGIDRLDNNQGYHMFNVVPCCIKCNRMKMDANVEDFVEHVAKIHGRMSNE